MLGAAMDAQASLQTTAPTARLARLSLSLPQLWAVFAVVFPAAFLAGRLYTVDLAYHVQAGDLMLQTHHLIGRDPFSFTAAGHGWLNQQWGAQLIFAGLYRAGGWAGLAAARSVLVALTFWMVYLACRARGAGMRTAALVTLASFAVTGFGLPLRPQALGMVLFALALWITADRRRYPGRLWAVAVAVAVWSNVHGSFFLGPLVLGLAWIEDVREGDPRARRTLLVAAVAAAATLANPFGPRVWAYVAGISTNPMIRTLIGEWQPPTLRSIAGIGFFVSGGAVALALARRGRDLPWPSLLWLAVFFALGLLAVRNVVWWALAGPPVMAAVFADPGGSTAREDRSTLNTLIAVCLVAACVLVFPWWGQRSDPPPQRLLAYAPPGITAELSRVLSPDARMFNAQLWGSWFEFALPGRPVFVDSRIELYPASVWRDYQDVSEGRADWQGILRRWGISVVVIDRTEQAGLLPWIRVDRGWRLAYEDGDGLIFVRSAAGAALMPPPGPGR